MTFAGQRYEGRPDPTAGVPLVRLELCPRCGAEKGRVHHARRGLCADCVYVLPAAERLAWAA